MLIYDVLHKEKVYHIVANDLRNLGVKYRFKKSMLKSERPESCKHVSKRVFKTPLFYQALDIVNLSSGGTVHVPVFVVQASTFLGKYIAQEGLFRKAGSHARQKELMSRLDNGGSLGEKSHAIDVANCLKSFFRNLPEPLIPYPYHDLFVHCALLKNCRIQALLLACVLLPPYHLNTLAFFMEFLKKVSMYEKQNKMSIENLAKVIGPNIMPLQDTSMSAVQNRLQMHLSIIKILIENSENIGILPSHIAQSISVETSGSTDNGFDSFQLRGKSKKKKHRSGSLTRMFNGLKKMVGKGMDDVPTISHQQPPVQLNVSSNKFTKKRKVIEREHPSSIKKKRMADKLDKSKKLRLSLDKFVPKNKQKNTDADLSDSSANNYKLCNERRWSSVSNSFDARKIRKCSDGILHFGSMKYESPNNNFQQEFEDVFTDATVDLSDDGGEWEDLLVKVKNHRRSGEPWHKINASTNSRKLNGADESDNVCLLMPEEKKTDFEEFNASLPHVDGVSLSSEDQCEEDYVRIPKSEYEDIKNRVSAIESRISQEFKSIYDEKNDITTHLVNKVQTAYEKTLEEASIESTLTSDYLAKKLSKELKIRRSAEQKIIRSPSARKIGILRRRSQEKVASKRVRRTASWHISPDFNLQHRIQLERQVNVCPVEKQSIFSSKYFEEQTYSAERYNNVTPNQMNALISRSEQRKISNNSNDMNLGLKDPCLTNNRTSTFVRRASSFHGKDFVDNSSYFDKKLDDSKKSNSYQNIALNNDYSQKDDTVSECLKEVSWKDADKYLKSATRTNTPVPQTGRASVAKLRAQNAGMVLAQARLFDECTSKASEFAHDNVSRKKHCRDNVNKRSPNIAREMDANGERFKQSHKRTQASRKQSNKDLKSTNCHATLSPSLQMKTQTADDVSLKPLEERTDYRSAQKLELQNRKLSTKDPSLRQTFAKDRAINVTESHRKENTVAKTWPLKVPISAMLESSSTSPYKPDVSRTPHIKRPLTVKTPKSSKLVRRPPVDTRRTPLRATAQLGTPKHQSPKSILKTRNLSMHT